jgi:toxin ParE1/3/4
MSNYIITLDTRADLFRIYQYGIAKFGLTQADKYFDAFHICFEEIAQKPYTYQSVEHIKIGFRRCVCGSDVIYFKINESIVEIMGILGHQDENFSL